jgi:signal transduction histidine kinase
LNYAEHVPASEKAKFENSIRRDKSLDPRGYPQFAIRPPGERSEYHVLTYLEPMAGVESSFGRDIIADPRIKEIFDRQILTSSDLSSSGRPPLIPGPQPFWAMAMRMPVYRQSFSLNTVSERKSALAGTLGAGFRVDELFKNVLDEDTLDLLHFRIYEAGSADGSQNQERLLLFDSRNPKVGPGASPTPVYEDADFKLVLSLYVAGRIWDIEYGARTADVMSLGAITQPWLVLFGGLLISVLLFGTAQSLASSRSRAVALAEEMTHGLQKSEAALRTYAERLKAVSRRLFEVQETERRLLATELHDRVGQNLSALGMNLSIISGLANPDEYTELASRIADSTSLIEQTADAMRNVMGELRPQAIDEFGLLAPLRSLAAGFSGRTGIRATVGSSAAEIRLPRTVELAMFRIAQEALNNIAKHSKAHQVDIELLAGNNAVQLTLKDDGVGFDSKFMETSRPEGHWGLLIMRERAEAAGARLAIESSPGLGTKLIIEYRS